MDIKRVVIDNLKNSLGWKTKRKIVVFSIDDYGNVRLDSKQAREKMDAFGMKVFSRFDAFDTLETKEDLEILFEALDSVKDKNGKSAVFTPFALSTNIDFEAMKDENYASYKSELLPVTFEKLTSLQPNAYTGAWSLWKEGIEKGLMVPQFHGREHFNLKVFKEKLQQKDSHLLKALETRSNTSVRSTQQPTIGYTAAFDFWDINENKIFEPIIKEGLSNFEKVYGYRAIQFNAPGSGEHPQIHPFLKQNGIQIIDTPFIKKEHQGKGKYKTKITFTGNKNQLGQTYQVRNVVFEPGENKNVDWSDYVIKQIEVAFKWGKPAIISSHRVNFCGHIDPANRKNGIDALKKVLKKIVAKWPDVEFMAASELGKLVIEKQN